jgi:hypothetical protein
VALPVTLAGAVLAGLSLPLLGRVGERRLRLLERAAAIALAALAGLMLLAFVAVKGGPAGAVDAVWNALAGSGQQVPQQAGAHILSTGANLRYRWWREAYDAFARQPFSGYGADTFSILDRVARPTYNPDSQPHNAGLQVLSGLGLVGGLPALTALVAAAVAVVAGVRRVAGEERAAACALGAIVLAFALHAQLDWDWSFTALTLLVYPLTGLVGGVAAPARLVRPARVEQRMLAGAAIAGAAVACALALAPYLSIRAALRATALDDAGFPERALVESDLARSLWPVATDPLLSQALYLQELGRTGAAKAALRRATRIEPFSYAVWERAGIFEVDSWHERQAGCESLRYAVLVSGHNPDPQGYYDQSCAKA